MDTSNPYAPPQAAVADVGTATGFQPVRIFSTRGRIGRLRLVAYNCAASLLFRIVGAGVVYGFFADSGKAHPLQLATLVLIGVAVYLVCSTLFLIQRAHDLDWSGWTVLIGLIPLVGLIFVFKRGTPGVNRYGLPPPPNTLGVKVLAMVFPFVVLLGIAAAIAIPAYQGYKARAAAAAPH